MLELSAWRELNGLRRLWAVGGFYAVRGHVDCVFFG